MILFPSLPPFLVLEFSALENYLYEPEAVWDNHSSFHMHKGSLYLYLPVRGLQSFSAKPLILANLRWVYTNIQ